MLGHLPRCPFSQAYLFSERRVRVQTGMLGHLPKALKRQLARFVDADPKLTFKAAVSQSTRGRRHSASMVLTVYAPVATAAELRSQLAASGVGLEPLPACQRA